MSGKRAAPIAACAIAILLVAASWVMWFAGGFSLTDAAGSYLLSNSAIAVTFWGFGAVVLANRPGHRIGLLFAGIGTGYALSVTCLGVRSGVIPLSAAWERLIDLIGITIWIPAIAVGLPLILQLFPNGRALSPSTTGLDR